MASIRVGSSFSSSSSSSSAPSWSVLSSSTSAKMRNCATRESLPTLRRARLQLPNDVTTHLQQLLKTRPTVTFLHHKFLESRTGKFDNSDLLDCSCFVFWSATVLQLRAIWKPRLWRDNKSRGVTTRRRHHKRRSQSTIWIKKMALYKSYTYQTWHLICFLTLQV